MADLIYGLVLGVLIAFMIWLGVNYFGSMPSAIQERLENKKPSRIAGIYYSHHGYSIYSKVLGITFFPENNFSNEKKLIIIWHYCWAKTHILTISKSYSLLRIFKKLMGSRNIYILDLLFSSIS